MDEIPESPLSSFQDAQIPNAILPDPFPQASLELLLVPIELPPMRSPPPAFSQGAIDDGNATTLSGLGSPENPILIDMDCEEGDTDSDLGSAQHPILIEDQDALPQSDGTETEPESDSGASIDATTGAEDEETLPRGLNGRASQQEDECFREDRSSDNSGLHDAGGKTRLAESATMSAEKNVDLASTTVQGFDNATGSDALVEPVTMAPGALPGADVALTDEPSAGCPSASVFATGHSEHLPSPRAITLAEELDNTVSVPLTHRNEIRSLSCQFGFCCYHESTVFGPYYLKDVTSMASSHVEGDQEKASSERRAQNSLWHRRAEDGKVEYLLLQPPIRQLEDQLGQILELVKLWREEKEKTGQTSRDSKVKKRAAPPSEPRKSTRPKKPRQL